MYSSEDLERFYLDYQSEWVPRGMTLQAYCSRNNVPYKVMENYSRNIQKKIVEVKVVGRPTEEPQQSVPSSPSSVQPQSEQSFWNLLVYLKDMGLQVSKNTLKNWLKKGKR